MPLLLVLRRERVKLEAEGTERLKDGSTFNGYFSSFFFLASEGTVGLACQNRKVRRKRVGSRFQLLRVQGFQPCQGLARGRGVFCQRPSDHLSGSECMIQRPSRPRDLNAHRNPESSLSLVILFPCLPP